MFSGILILRQHFAAYNYAALLFLVLIVRIHHTCSARNLNSYYGCAPSSCGNIRNIRYPFRLKTDPQNCGNKNKKYELACENNRAVVHLGKTTAKYYVLEINYDKVTIRLADAGVDKDNCSSIPHHSFSFDDDLDPYWVLHDGLRQLIFVTCANPVSSPLYVDTSSCNGNGTYSNNSVMSSSPFGDLNAYSYVVASKEDTLVGDLFDSCHIDMMVPIMPWRLENLTNLSYKQVHESMFYGFELSYDNACCEFAQENRCNLTATGSSNLYCPDMENPQGNPKEFLKALLGQLAGKDALIIQVRIIVRVRKPWVVSVELTAYWRRRIIGTTESTERSYFEFIIDDYLHGTYKTWKIQSFNLVFPTIVVAIIGLLHVALFFCGIPCLITLLIYKWRRRHLSMYDMIEEFLQSNDNRLMPVRYSYSEIKKITNGFKDKLGEGGYGSVYKGKLRSGRFAAIKMLSKSKANGQEFMSEVATIGRIHHVNVVQLIGFCAEGSKRALVYEFMPNGSLDKHIFYKEGSNIIPLSSEKMYQISLGVARGIEYLHRGCDMQILHFDIKPHNILLDENFNPKVSDFGLAKLYPTEKSFVSLTAARGTLGYMAPELFYKNIGGISYKADVYSFGMLLMEMVGRRKNFKAHAEHSSQIYFPSWVYDQLNEDKDIELGDVRELGRKTTKKMIIVALWCIQLMPNDRPSMQKVVEMLEAAEVERLQMPPKPFFTGRGVTVVNMEDPTTLTNPPDDIDSSYQFGR